MWLKSTTNRRDMKIYRNVKKALSRLWLLGAMIKVESIKKTIREWASRGKSVVFVANYLRFGWSSSKIFWTNLQLNLFESKSVLLSRNYLGEFGLVDVLDKISIPVSVWMLYPNKVYPKIYPILGYTRQFFGFPTLLQIESYWLVSAYYHKNSFNLQTMRNKQVQNYLETAKKLFLILFRWNIKFNEFASVHQVERMWKLSGNWKYFHNFDEPSTDFFKKIYSWPSISVLPSECIIIYVGASFSDVFELF